jgi:hypothetical protein
VNSEESLEKLKSSPRPQAGSFLTLKKAIEFGEYDPQFLSGFPEWHELSRHSQFQLIREALDNRRKHLLTQWAEINNVLNFSEKSYLNEALRNIEAQWKKLAADKEKLFLEYSK